MLFYQLEPKQICTQHSAVYNLAVTPIWTSPFANKNNSSRLENFSNSMPKEQATSLIFISPYVIYRASIKKQYSWPYYEGFNSQNTPNSRIATISPFFYIYFN